MDAFTLVDAAGLFLGVLAGFLLQGTRQAPAEGAMPRDGLRARLWPGRGTDREKAGIDAEAVLLAGPVVGRLRDADCHEWVMLRDGRRLVFAGAVALLPDGCPDLRWTPAEALVLEGGRLYVPEPEGGDR
jgi:hypothetical protein